MTRAVNRCALSSCGEPSKAIGARGEPLPVDVNLSNRLLSPLVTEGLTSTVLSGTLREERTFALRAQSTFSIRAR